MIENNTKKLALSAVFLAMAFLLPNLTGNIPVVGRMLLPMHLPVLICGFVCGGPWGAAVGFIAPLLRSVTMGMPAIFPTAIAMAVEMAVYGFLCGFLYHRLPKTVGGIYTALLFAMASGRVAWGIVRLLLTMVDASEFPFSLFIAGAFTTAIPGIILQLIAVPAIVLALQKSRMLQSA